MIKINCLFIQFIIAILPTTAITFEKDYKVLAETPVSLIAKNHNLVQASQIQPISQANTNEQNTHYKQSYIGIGANFGISGDTTGITDTNFTILGKTAFTENFALYDATTIFGDSTATSALALTGSIPIKNSAGQVIASPFIGGGALIRVTSKFQLDPLLAGGVDIPISQNITATVRVNVGFIGNETDAGLLIGVGYNYTGIFGK
ncbi:hypothetical protein DSM106972_086690 [Dulcicalothrix desertica PCC 7102]|uniref:Outer membrane protein beta-barrel domain-containing protein n=1 Tax=Dulcicalothrix desertica PCC 7102 TaxID=232991 RepID=A0A3S1A9P2_9CYAN|nr:hypothetical protein [Dulcicalothrix desertica]RUS96646.1 hypothetical protein DSM106972_086690 [Dulcicalothrix desertica PCC 7102]TWH43890.1 hypothetical protein CAL7102_07641 [Dulcicalothrix desertica PCC 7102]